MILTPSKRLLYLVSFVTLLYFLYPTNTEMVLLHLEGDDPLKGELFLQEALEKQPEDFDLRVLSAELNWAKNKVEPALEDLRVALGLKPANLRALVLNATYLEWSLRMDEAYEAWEKVIRRDPKHLQLPLKLASLAASLGKTTEAGRHAAAWLRSLDPPARESAAAPYFETAWKTLSRLAERVEKEQADELACDALYRLAASYSRSLGLFADGQRDFESNQATLLRGCVLAGLVDEAAEAAITIDGRSGGLVSRRLLLTLLENAGMSARAEEAMLAMVRQAPDQEDTLLALLNMGEDKGLDAAKTLALERLARVNPDEERYRSQLITQYVDAGRYDRVAELMDRLAWFTGAGIRYAKQVVAAAFVSGDSGFMARVSTESDKITAKDPEILSSRARLAIALRDYRKGAELAQALSELAPAETADALKKILAMGNYDQEAMGDALAVALSLTPEDTQLMMASAVNARARGHAEAAFALMRRCLLSSRDEALFGLLAEMARETAEPLASLAEADQLGERLFSASPDYLRAAVDIRLELDQPARAFEAQKALVRLAPSSGEAARMLELAASTDRAQDAREALDLCLSFLPGDAGLLRKDVELSLAVSDLKRAEAALGRLLALVPKDAAALRQMADLASWTGRPELEAVTLRRIRELGAASLKDDMRLAQALEASGQGVQALAVVQELLDPRPQDKELLRLGMQYALWNGRPEQAALMGERLCGLPGGESFLAATGEAWLAASEPARALPWLEKAKAAGRGGPEALHLLIQAYQGTNRFPDLLEIAGELEANGKLAPAEAVAVAAAHAALGRWKTVLDRLDPLRPTLDAEGELLLCQALERTGKKDEAVALMNRFTARYSKEAPLLVRMGEIAFSSGRLGTAGDIYRKALAIQPRNPVAMRGLASVLAEEGRPSKAARLMDGHNRVNPGDPDSRIQTAELQTSLGNEAKARREYKKALRLLGKATDVN